MFPAREDLQGSSQSTTRCPREGLLRYKRESEDMSTTINCPTAEPRASCYTFLYTGWLCFALLLFLKLCAKQCVQSHDAAEPSIKCEYCGENAIPLLDMAGTEDPEEFTVYCCAQHQELCQLLRKQKCLFEARCSVGTKVLTSMDTKTTMELEELLNQARKRDEERAQDENYVPPSKVLRFRLSHNHGNETSFTNEEDYGAIGDKVYPQDLAPVCGHNPSQFGLCYQDGPGFQHKYYPNGKPFLTVFPDASAQVFYPSGLLALVVVVTEQKGRVCLVYDDSHATEQPVRAVFQSDGRATCYHGNGNIWLSLERSGGQCLDEAGTRVRRWHWSSLDFTSAPLRPVFLSLNKSVGVRVLGEDQVFVSFLANGQQAKFSMGTCCVQVQRERRDPSSKRSVMKYELFLLAARIRVHLAIQQLHQRLLTQSSPLLQKITVAPRLLAIIQRLMTVSDDVKMTERERDFIIGCLQYCF
ncbi:glutamate-rich protein 6 [Genypterus blacodes]|uniref:glutamate-rich protein 6 n=1 Tax=Genypterus blacodes TaxID=154954 RepID=UPI003F760F6D